MIDFDKIVWNFNISHLSVIGHNIITEENIYGLIGISQNNFYKNDVYGDALRQWIALNVTVCFNKKF